MTVSITFDLHSVNLHLFGVTLWRAFQKRSTFIHCELLKPDRPAAGKNPPHVVLLLVSAQNLLICAEGVLFNIFASNSTNNTQLLTK